MNKRINISEKLNLRKIKKEFQSFNSFYFSEINYGNDGRFFDLYFQKNEKGITESQVVTYNMLIESLNKHLTKINSYIKNNYTTYELKKSNKLNRIKLDISVVEILSNNQDFDSVVICGKQYRLFGFLKRDIGVRVELKNGRIKSMERKADTTKENGF